MADNFWPLSSAPTFRASFRPCTISSLLNEEYFPPESTLSRILLAFPDFVVSLDFESPSTFLNSWAETVCEERTAKTTNSVRTLFIAPDFKLNELKYPYQNDMKAPILPKSASFYKTLPLFKIM